MNKKTTVPVNVEIDDEMIETLCEMAGFGISYWAVSAHLDVDARTYHVVPDTDDDEDPQTLTFEKLAETLARVASEKLCRSDLREAAMSAIAEKDAGEIDSELADVVVQIAMFGDIVYG